MIGEKIHRFINKFNTIKTDVPRISSWIQNERNLNKHWKPTKKPIGLRAINFVK